MKQQKGSADKGKKSKQPTGTKVPSLYLSRHGKALGLTFPIMLDLQRKLKTGGAK